MKRHSQRREVKARYIVPLLLVLLIVVYQCGRWLELRDMKPEPTGDFEARYEYGNVLELDGVQYRQRSGVETLLIIGVDQDSADGQTGYRNGGQSDFLQLLVMDKTAKTVTRLEIDRDTMTPITVLGVLGQRAGERTAQISLAHNFGGDEFERCELTADAVSGLMLGTEIDDFISMELSGIPALNDMLGGVTVTVKDDFSKFDPAMVPGATVTLNGEQAELFVRARSELSVGTNEARMERQRVYLDGLARQLDARMAGDKTFIDDMYLAIEPYMTTDMSRGGLVNRVWSTKDYSRTVATIPGEHVVGSDGFMQFHPDEDGLKRLVIELFYQPVAK